MRESERLSRPDWYVDVALAALLGALAGATMITLANRETPMPGREAPTEAPQVERLMD